MKMWRHGLAVLLAFSLLALACGDDDDGGEAVDLASLPNTCPADGCSIGFANVEKAGDELSVTWDMNFNPLFAGNHIHIYWDTYRAEEVSGDAADNGFEQGEWVPTDVQPTYTTEGAVSTSARQGSTTLCVVAADGDHNVIDPSTQVCRDVSDLL